MKHLVSTKVSNARVANWIVEASERAVDMYPTWTERRMAIEFGGHTYLVESGQVYQCAHCGHYDPKWSTTEVLSWFEETFGIKPHEIEITCSVAVSK